MPGRFVWFELATADFDAAAAFYAAVMGWKTQIFDESPTPTPYRMWVSRQGPLGGVMELSADLRAQGVTPNWWGHVDVEDVEATVTRVEALGGAVHIPPTGIPGVGRFSIVGDPQGATFSVFQPNSEQVADDPAKRDKSGHGEFCWSELHARDGKEALPFYLELFGWTVVDERDMGPAGTYSIFAREGEWLGGIMTGESYGTGPSWMYYVNVEDLDVAIARTEAEGGRTLYGPIEIPGGSRIAHLADPQGAVFGVTG